MRIRRYEMVFILPPDLEEAKEKEILDRLDGIIQQAEGVLIQREDWGVRKLAYEINKCSKGHYYLMDFAGSTEIVTELERNLKIIENVLRFLTIKKDEHIDLDRAKQAQAEAKEKSKPKPEIPPEPESEGNGEEEENPDYEDDGDSSPDDDIEDVED